MIKAIIFDMDGLLIDSEPLWQEAEIEIFEKIGILLNRELCLETTGLRVDEVVEYWYQRNPWTTLTQKEVAQSVINQVIRLIYIKGKPKEGVSYILDFFQTRNVKIALATSSSHPIINVVLEKLGIQNVFLEICSAVEEEYGKPHPSVYLKTAKKLQVLPQECLVLEDSLNGVIAAKSAQMKCIAIPENFPNHNPKFIIADFVLKSLLEIQTEIWQKLNQM